MWLHGLPTSVFVPITLQRFAGSRTSLQTPPLRLAGGVHHPGSISLLCHCLSQTCQVVLEYQPAVHRLRLSVLGLGPDLPWVDNPLPGNLRLSMGRILTCLALLIPAFSLLCTPRVLTVTLRRAHYAPLPIETFYVLSQSFGDGFSPVVFSAHNHSTSELLRTL